MSEALTKEQFLALVETNIDNIADLPEYINPVPGTYIVGVDKAEVKDMDTDKPYIHVGLLYKATQEQTGEQAEYAEGSPLGFRYYGELGIKRFKKHFQPVFEATSSTTISELLDRMSGMELGIVTTQRKDKDDPEKKYTDLKLVVVV
jgi:hypothetical protein